ncbi:MAG: hypothetical protein AUJ12_09965 [Alphaproteobacteria bacterium CG1_02_46_17]|nr:MAG: hypothetical protein AUJ12_09965 [Alphaproteobacteria bacterium CG1_02_46_17]
MTHSSNIPNNQMSLPRLRYGIKIFSGAADPASGEPTGMLHDPVSHSYYKLSWAECECLSRFPLHEDVDELIKDITSNTSLDIDQSDILNLLEFLKKNHLLEETAHELISQPKEQGALNRLLHHYLYFTVPLFKPQKFLDISYPYVSPLFSKGMTWVVLVSLFILVIMTIERADEFFSQFAEIPSLSGIVMVGIVFAFIKIIHEWAHAFTATKFKVPVPHMGIAVIAMYPVLYTETTGVWRLQNRFDRMAIGFAGIRAELALATIFLLFWHLSPSGTLMQIVSFYVVAVSLVSSLLINLNPLMRFDGYYLLSDFTGIENLQMRACNFARYALRRFLFAWNDPPPEYLPVATQKFLILFGALLLVYRFFLFSGIALLVYALFFQPLGTILFLVEVWVFLLRPILSELKVWKDRSRELFISRRSRIMWGTFGVILLFLVLPLDGTVSAPAVEYHKNYWEAHAPDVAQVKKILVANGGHVKKGDVLMILGSAKLQQDRDLMQAKLGYLESLKRGESVSTASPRDENKASSSLRQGHASLEEQIILTLQSLEAMDERLQKLVMTAPFDGEIRDMLTGVQDGRTVKTNDILFRLIDPESLIYVTYVPETDRDRISINGSAKFIKDGQPFSSSQVEVRQVEEISSPSILSPELFHDLNVNAPSNNGQPDMTNVSPRQSVFKIVCEERLSDNKNRQSQADHLMKKRGILLIDATQTSPLISFLHQITGLVRRELNLN